MKKIARIFASSLMRTTLFSAAITAAIVSVLGSPTTIKKSLNDSKIYDTLVTNVLKEANKKSQDKGSSDDVIGKPAVQQAAKTALTPEVLRQSTEQILTGVYDWLGGKTTLPDYKVDLTGVKANFIQAAGDAAATQVTSLPTCTAQQLRELNGQDDPFSLTCRPANLTAAAAKDKVVSQLSTNNDFLKDPVLTASTFKNDKGESVFAQANQAPKAFQKVKTAPWVLLLLSVALGAAVFFLSEDYRKGTKRLARLFLSVGVVVSIIGLVTGVVFTKLAAPSGVIGQKITNDLQASILDAGRHLSSAFSRTILTYGLIYVVLGGITLLVLKFLWKKTDDKVETPKEDKKPIAPTATLV